MIRLRESRCMNLLSFLTWAGLVNSGNMLFTIKSSIWANSFGVTRCWQNVGLSGACRARRTVMLGICCEHQGKLRGSCMYLYAYILLLPLKLTFPLFTNLRVIKWIHAESAAIELEKSGGQPLIANTILTHPILLNPILCYPTPSCTVLSYIFHSIFSHPILC